MLTGTLSCVSKHRYGRSHDRLMGHTSRTLQSEKQTATSCNLHTSHINIITDNSSVVVLGECP